MICLLIAALCKVFMYLGCQLSGINSVNVLSFSHISSHLLECVPWCTSFHFDKVQFIYFLLFFKVWALYLRRHFFLQGHIYFLEVLHVMSCIYNINILYLYLGILWINSLSGPFFLTSLVIIPQPLCMKSLGMKFFVCILLIAY